MISALEKQEQMISEYLKYAMAIDKTFQFEPVQPNSINLPFTWYDSFNQNAKNKITYSSMKFEMACHIYNLSIILMQIGLRY